MEGLNSLNYQLLSYNKTALYTHVYVSVNKSEVSKVSYSSWLNLTMSISQEDIIKLYGHCIGDNFNIHICASFGYFICS